MANNENMLFHEVYGSYYLTVAKILAKAVEGTLDQQTISQTVRRYAFAESWSPEGLSLWTIDVLSTSYLFVIHFSAVPPA